MIRAVIFDCFGVIVGKGFEHTYRTAGGDPVKDRAFIEDMLGQANMGLITDENFRYGMARQLDMNVENWRQAVKTAETADARLLDYIKQLRTKYKTAILSNANTGTLERKIGKLRLRECFDEVIVSAEVGIIKPDPRIYKLTAERLEVPAEECVFIDDHKIFLDAARREGMKTVLYSSFKQIKAELANIQVSI